MVKTFYGIIGAGGHGREVMPLARKLLARELDQDDSELLFVVENLHEEGWINGHRVVSLNNFINYSGDLRFNIAIGNSLVRERISQLLINAGLSPFGIISDDSRMLDMNTIGKGYTISSQTIITSNVTIGDFFQANCQCVISHDCRIGNFVTFAPGVRCNGNVIIEDHAYVGAGAVILNGSGDHPLRIGTKSIVGMGAIVITDVEPYATVVGNPARKL